MIPSLWNPLISQLTPYTPGEQPKSATQFIKLNTNENPYPPSPLVFETLKKGINDQLRLYPDPNSEALKEAIASYHNATKQNIFVGNGSDEVLAHTFLALLKHDDKPILFPDITYSFYPVYCHLYQIAFNQIPVTQNFKIDLKNYPPINGGVIFPNPNAPTGRLLSLDDIKFFLEKNRHSVVVIDEAYIDFGGETAIPLIEHYPNLLIIRTFSKSRALAGMRLGYAIGQPHLIKALERVKNSFNSYPIDRLTELAGIASLKDEPYFQKQCQHIINQRESLIKELDTLEFTTLPSSANFILTQPPKPYTAELLASMLKEHNIIIRYFDQKRLDTHLRISIGTEKENEQLINTIKKIYDKS